jgi:hypothetical protein
MMTRSFHALDLSGPAGSPALPLRAGTADADAAARTLMTDLCSGPRIVVADTDPLDRTLHLMQAADVHMAFVTDVDGELAGHVTADDLQGERPVQRALADHLRHNELTLAHVMTPLAAWQVIDEAQLAHARVGDIVATLHAHSLRYLPVVRTAQGRQLLVGLFSARAVEEALGTAIQADLHSRNFAELGASIGH